MEKSTRVWMGLVEKGKKGRTITDKGMEHIMKGKYVYIPKCNFDVEMCIDAIRLMDYYDTFCLFSSDADFVSLLKFLKGKNKKVILIKGGHTRSDLKKQADLVG